MISVKLCARGDVFVLRETGDGRAEILASPYGVYEAAAEAYGQRGINLRLLCESLTIEAIFQALRAVEKFGRGYRQHVRWGTYKQQLLWMAKEIRIQ